MHPDFELAPDETIICQFRKHWINVVPIFVGCFILAAVMLALIYAVARYGDSIAKTVPLPIVSLLVLVMAGLTLLIAIVAYWVYTQNRIIVSTQHIIQITQAGLFSRKVSQLSLAKVQDVSSSRNGLVATILGFGNITIETAGEEENFTFSQVPDPYGLAQTIMKAHEALVKPAAGQSAPAEAV
jgi:uncharacterized membrane protein YdbT with pleckstrin-like domain